MVTQEQINGLKARAAKLGESIDVEQRQIELQNEQERTEESNFWDNPDEARKQLKKVADIKAVLDEYAAVCRMVDDVELIPDFVADGAIGEDEAEAQYLLTVEAVEKLELKQMLSRSEEHTSELQSL